MPRRTNVLAVPSEAVAKTDGQDVCFVVHEAGLERREVKLGQVTEDMTEVTEGLREGEQVVLHAVIEPEDLLKPGASRDVPSSISSSSPDLPAGTIAALR
jgi:multidrug efflux pump subunit AcrA (membrane-fusion protein)